MSTTHATTTRTVSRVPPKTVEIHIQRRANPDAPQYWEQFEIPYRPNLNVISLLDGDSEKPCNERGRPRQRLPSGSMNCLEQVCGICTMIINGRARQSCSALIDHLEQPIKLEPMSKFPNVRDLIVDRSQMFDHLKTVHAWVELDGTHDLGPGPRMDQDEVQERYAYSRCMTCGCCLEACPQYEDDNYIGPQAIAQVRLFNMHPSGKMNREERLEGIMQEDGITNCGNAQNCVQACPMAIPLTKAIYEENREAVVYGLLGWLRK